MGPIVLSEGQSQLLGVRDDSVQICYYWIPNSKGRDTKGSMSMLHSYGLLRGNGTVSRDTPPL